MSLGKPMGKLDTLLQVGRTFGMRDGMLRLQYELQRGSGLLSWRMRSVQGWDSWDLKKSPPAPKRKKCGLHAGMEASNFSLPIRKPWERASKKLSDVTEKPPFSLKRKRILQGNLPFFGQLSYACWRSPALVSQPRDGPERLAAAVVDPYAVRFSRIRRSEIYSRALQIFILSTP